ncbi:hypothetical protein EJB05_56018 [Eragrostis curvula]|uniref:Uncharacterized protein n=1 Tax=Eragrostis curvula TaxID=38414 RepID=A0A5J9SH86_9POAL|nr:hypothetical protein EJB05_56018 [Eragrostis curvula]
MARCRAAATGVHAATRGHPVLYVVREPTASGPAMAKVLWGTEMPTCTCKRNAALSCVEKHRLASIVHALYEELRQIEIRTIGWSSICQQEKLSFGFSLGQFES